MRSIGNHGPWWVVPRDLARNSPCGVVVSCRVVVGGAGPAPRVLRFAIGYEARRGGVVGNPGSRPIRVLLTWVERAPRLDRHKPVWARLVDGVHWIGNLPW